jgi:hypothetical protein
MGLACSAEAVFTIMIASRAASRGAVLRNIGRFDIYLASHNLSLRQLLSGMFGTLPKYNFWLSRYM